MILALIGAALIGVAASWSILRRQKSPPESQFAASTEGVKRCPKCAMSNVWTDTTCASCGGDLPG